VKYLPFHPKGLYAILVLCVVAGSLLTAANAQNWNSGSSSQWQGRLRGEDQQRFDDYYRKWLSNRERKDKGEIASMEVRMLDVYAHNNISSEVPYGFVASSNVALPINTADNYRGRLSGDDQKKIDSYYQRWLEYRRKKDKEQIASMEGRMLDVLSHNNLPLTTPYELVVSPNVVPPSAAYPSSAYPGGGSGPNYGGDLRILQALYGVPGRQTDVSGRLQSMVNNGSLNVRVNNDLSGSDPAPGSRKQLYVVYSYRGEQRNMTVDEGNDLRIPSTGYNPDPGYNAGGDLRIVQAFWGVPGRQSDVSGRLQSMVTSNGLSLRVNNDSMGSDPAPGSRKQLYVVYSYRGQQRTTTVDESNELHIP
jgi:hypothetical protein